MKRTSPAPPATEFNYKAFQRSGSDEKEIPVNKAGYSGVVRPLDNTGKPTDVLGFRSEPNGLANNRVFDRYKPTWRCTLTDSQDKQEAFTITEGNVPDKFTLKNDKEKGTSEVTRAVRDNRIINCSVEWTPKFSPATVQLSKTVDGTAQDFTSVLRRKFDIKYTCQSDDAYKQAYPDNPLEGTVELQKGEARTLNSFPAGANCTFSESFPEGDPAVRPGKSLDLTWSTGEKSGNSRNAEQKTTVKLGETVNLRANNQYNFRAGSVTINKQLLGDAAPELGDPKTYRFRVRCEGTPFTVEKDLVIRNNGGNRTGSVTVDGLPVARDCYLRPLTGLSQEESRTIQFDGRDVNFNGQHVDAESNGEYKFRLDDYQEGATPTKGTLDLKTTYNYKVRDVTVVKDITGDGAGSSDLEGKTFPAAYRCTWKNGGSKEGKLELQPNASEPAKIEGVPVDADCLVWEENSPELENVRLQGTEVSASSVSDNGKTLKNDEAKKTPILKVSPSTDAGQNRVIVRNTYARRIGSVDLHKIVDSNLSVPVPENYTFNFTCGTRTVVRGDGTSVPVELKGTVQVNGGQTQGLVADVADPELAELVNDRNGKLGVPYGNKCSFEEKQPDFPSDVIWNSDAEESVVTVSQDTTTNDITNKYTAAGKGLTITQRNAGVPQLSEPVEYSLRCTLDGEDVDLGEYSTIKMDSSQGDSNVEIPADVLPEGTECQLREKSAINKTRKGDKGQDFPVQRDSTSRIANTSSPAEDGKYDESVPVDIDFSIGDTTTLSITHTYKFVTSSVTANKVVEFDPATQQYISDTRKDTKNHRKFPVTLQCTAPIGGARFSTTGDVVAAEDAKATVSLDGVPAGSTCVASEGQTNTAEGITLTQQTSAGGGPRQDGAAEFTVGAESTPVTFYNSYSRQMDKLLVKKSAHLPGDIRGQMGDRLNDNLYEHNFNVVCKDPETDDKEQLSNGTFVIKGEGENTVEIPVGADCQITGDHFGSLKLNDGEDEAYVRPEHVEWVVDSNDGDRHQDRDLVDGVTESQMFRTVSTPEGQTTPANQAVLHNYYEYERSNVRMDKDVVVSDADWNMLDDDFAMDFTMQCKGVGYQTSTIGQGDKTLPTRLTKKDFKVVGEENGKKILRYNSDDASVPAGALCTFTEAGMDNLPDSLKHSVDEQTVRERAPEPDVKEAQPLKFVNRFDRKTAPVRLAVLQDGYFKDLEPGYKASFVCKPSKGGASEVRVERELGAQDIIDGGSVANPSAPNGGVTVDLPVGYDCELDLDGSPALGARNVVENIDGNRQPVVQFNHWADNKADQNDLSSLAKTDRSELKGTKKNYKHSFTVPDNLAKKDAEEFVVGAEVFSPRAVRGQLWRQRHVQVHGAVLC